MTPITAALRELMAAGVTGEKLVAAIERIELAAFPTRTKHAMRQERYRERHKASQSVTSDAPQPPATKRERRRSMPLELAPEFMPDLSYATGLGWPMERAQAEAQRFLDSAEAHGRKYCGERGWRAAWRNWCTSPYQGKANGSGHGRTQTLGDRARELAQQARDAERAAGISGADDDFGSH